MWKFYFKMLKYNKNRNLIGWGDSKLDKVEQSMDWNINKQKKFQTEKREEWEKQKTREETNIIPWQELLHF